MARLTLTTMLASVSVALLACTDGLPRDDFACVYEERRTACDSSTFGPWQAACSRIDFEIRDDLTPETFCEQAYPPNDTECAGGCCIDFQFRDVSAQESCP